MTRIHEAIDRFLEHTSSFEAERVFNPWGMNCPLFDNEYSFDTRRENLRMVLSACAFADEVDVWVGRDLGWRGGRRTGVALVDEINLDDYAFSIGLPRLKKATKGPPMRERTATEVHIARERVTRKLFFWNVFPFHPHEDGNPQSNRMHTKKEREIGISLLTSVLKLIPFNRVITIGADATSALQAAEIPCCPVRHPSYGGQKDFHRQIDLHYEISVASSEQRDLFDYS